MIREPLAHTDVLDRGFVELLDVMGDDNAVVSAARVSFLGESRGAELDRRLLNYLVRNRHYSPLEMVEFKFRLKAPVMVWWHLVRHRTFNFNLQSGRYTPFKEDEFYLPTVWRKQSENNKQGTEGELSESDSTYLTALLLETYDETFSRYETALAMGAGKEQARLFLAGWGSYYTGYVKGDARNFLNFTTLRMAPDAQMETRVYAEAMFQQVAPIIPWTIEAYREYVLGIQDESPA